jgi:hypothetical protein
LVRFWQRARCDARSLGRHQPAIGWSLGTRVARDAAADISDSNFKQHQERHTPRMRSIQYAAASRFYSLTPRFTSPRLRGEVGLLGSAIARLSNPGEGDSPRAESVESPPHHSRCFASAFFYQRRRQQGRGRSAHPDSISNSRRTSDAIPHSRGANSPELCMNVPRNNRGRRESRVPEAPAASRGK